MVEVQDTVAEATVKRVERGMVLAALGQVRKHGDRYVVQSSCKGRYYIVNLDNENGECCECKDWKRNGFGHSCKHIFAATLVAARA